MTRLAKVYSILNRFCCKNLGFPETHYIIFFFLGNCVVIEMSFGVFAIIPQNLNRGRLEDAQVYKCACSLYCTLCARVHVCTSRPEFAMM